MCNGEISLAIVESDEQVVIALQDQIREWIVIDQSQFQPMQVTYPQINGALILPSVVIAISGNGQLPIAGQNRCVLRIIAIELTKLDDNRIADCREQVIEFGLDNQTSVSCHHLSWLKRAVVWLLIQLQTVTVLLGSLRNRVANNFVT